MTYPERRRDYRRLLVTSLFLSTRPLPNYHFIAVLRSLGARFPGAFTLGLPAPNGHGVLVRF